MDPNTDTPPAATSARDRLKALKAELSGRLTTTLPVSGIEASYPAFIRHDQVMAATKLAGKNRARVGGILVAQLCLFEGERLTVDEVNGELLHNRDALHLVNLVFGEDEDDAGAEEGDAGN